MARGKYEVYIFTVDTVEVGTISLNKDIIDRFNITGLVLAETATGSGATRERKPHQRKVYTDRTVQTTTRLVNVRRVISTDVKRKNRPNSGKKIKVPLDFPVANAPSGSRGAERMTTINFPLKASNYQVARWINTHFTAHKPSYFVTPAGARFPVNIPQIMQQTAGEAGGTPAPAGAT